MFTTNHRFVLLVKSIYYACLGRHHFAMCRPNVKASHDLCGCGWIQIRARNEHHFQWFWVVHQWVFGPDDPETWNCVGGPVGYINGFKISLAFSNQHILHGWHVCVCACWFTWLRSETSSLHNWVYDQNNSGHESLVPQELGCHQPKKAKRLPLRDDTFFGW